MDPLPWSSELGDALPYIVKEMAIDEETVSAIGYQLEEIIFWCRYNNHECNLTRYPYNIPFIYTVKYIKIYKVYLYHKIVYNKV